MGAPGISELVLLAAICGAPLLTAVAVVIVVVFVVKKQNRQR